MHKKIAWIIFNGPSSQQYRNLKLPGVVFGCNFAYKDFDIDYLYAVDRITVHNIRKDNPDCECWTKKSNLNLELPPNWNHTEAPGIDSGSFALEQAMLRYPQYQKIVIGADGILNIDHATVYKYHWRQGYTPTAKTHETHRKTVIGLLEQYRQNILFACNKKDSQLETIPHADTIRKIHMEIHG